MTLTASISVAEDAQAGRVWIPGPRTSGAPSSDPFHVPDGAGGEPRPRLLALVGVGFPSIQPASGRVNGCPGSTLNCRLT